MKVTTLDLYVIQPPIVVIGLAANIINIVSFVRLGLGDSISLCFCCLSCSEFVTLFVLFGHFLLGIMVSDTIALWRVDGLTLSFLLYTLYMRLYDTSQLIKTFIAVQRCCCVAMPHRFKNTFTRYRCLSMVTAIVVFSLVAYIPLWNPHGFGIVLDPISNSTFFGILAPFWPGTTLQVNQILTVLAVTTACHATNVICLGILISSLNASTKFRLSLSTGYHTSYIQISKRGIAKNSTNPSNQSGKGGKKIQPKRKELQAMQSATFVSLIFVVCNTPKILVAYASFIEVEFSFFYRYSGIYNLISMITITLEYINTSSSMFVYLKFNTRFRQTVLSFVNCLRNLQNN